ncbi:MAG: ATP-binding protein [Desulfobacterales bacterium]|nr:ATP-binding protein [Desulfobacterales bacterium]
MDRLNQLTIKARMILSLFLFILLFILFGIISMHHMETLGKLTATLYNHPLQVSNAALKAKSGIISMHRHMKDVSTSQTQSAVALAIGQVRDAEVQVYKELALIQELILGDEGKRLVKETTEMFTGWKPIRAEVQNLVLQQHTEEANRITREKGADYVNRLEHKMSVLTRYAITKADGFMSDATRVRGTLIWQTAAFIVAIILIAMGIDYFISTSILSNVSVLKTAMKRIIETGDLTTATVRGSNEITEMTQSFNALIQQLKHRFWVSEGQGHLSRKLSGDVAYDTLLKNALEFTCQYMNAGSGALYLFSSSHDELELKTAYAKAKGTHFEPRFKPGEGIVGQVARERTPILLNHIDPMDARLCSGTQTRPPAALYALPLLFEETVYGVMEVATLNPMDSIEKEFLTASTSVISMAIHTASQGRRIRKLLDQSHQANTTLHARTEELQEQTRQLQALNEEFQEQSQALQSKNNELDTRRRQVEEADRLKSEFLSNMSHELRTPLNSVNTLSRVLILQTREKLSPDEIQYLEIIERNGKHLLSLINDLLDLSKIEAGHMEISTGRFSMNALLETLVENLRPLAREKNIDLVLEPLPPMPPMETDEARVFQILQNIIANAVKFTREGGVSISTQILDSPPAPRIQIQVRDTGIGIPKEDLVHIFDEFRQVDGASTRRFEGTGLGLAIAKKAAQMLGGKIQVESREDRGTCFTLDLPLPQNTPDLEEMPAPQPEPILPHPPEEPATLLVVEDNPDNMTTVKAVLQNRFTLLEAEDGEKGLASARVHRPQAILLDMALPGMDGLSVVRELRTHGETAEIPVIALTAQAMKGDRETMLEAGCNDYVSKPIDPGILLETLDKWTHQGHAHESNPGH